MATAAAPRATVTIAPGVATSPAVVKVSGVLDVQAEQPVEDAILAMWWRASSLVLDVSELEFCSSSGMSVFVRLARHYASGGGHLALAAPHGVVRRLLTRTNVGDSVAIYESVAGALRQDHVERVDRAWKAASN